MGGRSVPRAEVGGNGGPVPCARADSWRGGARSWERRRRARGARAGSRPSRGHAARWHLAASAVTSGAMTVCPVAIALLALAAGAEEPALPACAPGWQLEIIAIAPEIKHPTVVTFAPDGRFFVAEDPMDISAPASSALGRVLCFHPDGRTTEFAAQLHAVFGMQYIEGQLYVLHNPRLTVFRDGGDVGADRRDLIESTNPEPWALDWNDHVPANFRLAMDGYLYVSVGDKGVYECKGRDGKAVSLHGGGILRLRPDA